MREREIARERGGRERERGRESEKEEVCDREKQRN